MAHSEEGILAKLLRRYEDDLLQEWVQHQLKMSALRPGMLRDNELREQSRQFLTVFREAVQDDEHGDITTPPWAQVREILADLSRRRVVQGFSPSETAMFVFALKESLFTCLRRECGQNPDLFTTLMLTCSTLLDKLGLYTTEIYQQSREAVVTRQQEELLELSTPVVKLWQGILALPLIGTLDSARTQIVMESLLQAIVEQNASIAIIDITGVPTVDTLVAQHLLQTVAAARLMGADCIISGIRPQIAQTIVHLGIELSHVNTKASLADAFAMALQRGDWRITKHD
jgi:rsbT co-antagonist protein RsbR